MASFANTIGPLEQESTAGLIATRIRDAIADGTLPPGSQLGEAQLAKAFGVSRGPLREGMQRLTQEGLLVSHRNRGLFVIEMTPENVRDMYLARSAVERAAAREIFHRDPQSAGKALMRAAEAMRKGAAAKNAKRLAGADVDFHATLVAAAGSARLSRMHGTLLTETRLCIHASQDIPLDPADRARLHADIAQTFLDNDPGAADRLLLEHMEASARLLVGEESEPLED